MTASRAERWADLPADLRAEFMARLYPTREARARLRWDWSWWGRPEQIWRPGPETYTLMTAGRGFGKTSAGAHAVHYVAQHPELCGGRVARGPDDRAAGRGGMIGIAGRTANDVNETMVDGDTGIMASCPPELRPVWNKQRMTLTWANGVKARLMTGDVPASFRGPNFGFIWADELPHWSKAEKSWSAAEDALRKSSAGHHPRGLITSTPLGTSLILRLAFQLADGQPIKAPLGTPEHETVMAADHCRYLRNPDSRVIGGSTYENASNLSDRFMTRTVAKYAGTRDGDQEIEGLIRLGTPGALWVQDWIQRCEDEQIPADADRRAVVVDPSVSDGQRVKGSDDVCECGIIGTAYSVKRRRLWLTRDASLVARPRDWADRVVALALEIDAHEIVAEDNNGGGMVRENVEAAWLRARAQGRRKPKIVLVTAHRNKAERAAFAAPAWEAGKVTHVGPARRWVALERQLTTYDPNRPHDRQQADRMDAAVWAALHHLGDGTDRARVSPLTTAEAWTRIAAGMGRAAQGRG